MTHIRRQRHTSTNTVGNVVLLNFLKMLLELNAWRHITVCRVGGGALKKRGYLCLNDQRELEVLQE